MLASEMITPALELRQIYKSFPIKGGLKTLFGGKTEAHIAVNNVTLCLKPKTVLGLVGESGSGKSTCGLMAMRLLEATQGQIFVNGQDVTNFDHAKLKPIRRQMQIIFQNSYESLNPMMTLTQIIAEPYVIHDMHTRRERVELAGDLLEMVGLDRSYGNRYAHELSGGQRQRVSIARALALKPNILVADEPTSALDVSVKAQVINLLHDLQQEMGLSILFISHELNVIRSLADEIAVMYRGHIVEQAPTETIFQNARHPYTKSLLNAIPSLDPKQRSQKTFITPAQINEQIPVFRRGEISTDKQLDGLGPHLVEISDGHFVEAFIKE
ncbi:MAG: ABC transporter ATP-binding protein [Rhizobiales bacterium]|nr:ATP-binding cassette domain-containing protein [Hyphomicrobiales bacterium]NRB14345.1 ABC transporter ATP-binding protein [Hyphomicrobiales bacterium]